ncbi:hypothetical protein [Sulfitobacter sp. R18_1]|uniref:hypothetical protein n=1 Tax=Sulfitobacter sp. R18_1 TaxID=2821104 RepID=UPI001ADCD4AF|nr:hypothetical protein [Sulfitobacter sp. R18_1]MBO9428313.1 hypothetical protein [Sulfitobacter sp. R18_1]
MTTTQKYLVHKLATCHECNFQSDGRYAERDARNHALETGHIPTLEVAYDISVVSDKPQQKD